MHAHIRADIAVLVYVSRGTVRGTVRGTPSQRVYMQHVQALTRTLTHFYVHAKMSDILYTNFWRHFLVDFFFFFFLRFAIVVPVA